MSSLPPVTWLQAFEAAARSLSFTRAGEELAVSQSAISQRIRLLEDRLGQALFVRHPRSLTLTEAGQAWLPSIQEAFARLAQGTAEVFGPEPDAPVIIRATPAVQQYWLAPRLCALHRAYPDLALRIVTGVWSRDFVGEDADIEIRYGQGDWAETVCESLGEERMTPLCTPAIAERLVSPADLGNETLLHAAGFAVGWPAWLAAAGVEEIAHDTRHLWCDTQVMTLRLAAHGCGVALAHRRLMGLAETLVAPFEIECPTEEGFWLTRPARRSPREPARRVWAWLADQAGQEADSDGSGTPKA
ncbi:LysR substrate-binding domain-containing protein [Kushneria phosphatilytica]|uniref:LysR family transcriptional regulator n=1 Tax=Kushneria phosphatilytica TaxID=657387 RepID=A0A1S1NUD5_9GAMM|nr:LysR substrate-binding domain-containing protein [Kushneria phosphatilytica]OHV13798.1 LysR family transcriptional regulator [Kushneria phosphatilytica]QEL10347.1 LysR family transcriptional regulator [Kushneria phosphatilytica]